jgi:hypothetical protein
VDLVYSDNSATTTDSGVQSVDYIPDNVSYLIALATSHALPTAYHDKRAISPALRDQLVKQVEGEQAGSALMVVSAPAVD